ncbi:hypothetical protein OC835_005682 [Tilletia horrida]|nr:hypothetical protein OC835_005682 [Tilletia horrida]
MAGISYVVLYDVVSSHGPPRHCLPNPWVGRMCLVHKGVHFENRHVTLEELRREGQGSLRARFAPSLPAHERLLVPMIEVCHTDGSTTLVGDTLNIAEYLDANFPHAPSLFVPCLSGPDTPDVESSEYRQAQTMARFLKDGLGGSDSRWTRHFELVSSEIADRFQEHEREMLSKESTLNVLNGKELFATLDRADLIAHTRRSLLPLCSILSPAPPPKVFQSSPPRDSARVDERPCYPPRAPPLFLASPDKPGLLDYILFGRYAMTRAAAPEINTAIWSVDSRLAREWLAGYEGGKWALRGRDAEVGRWDGDVHLPGIEDWVQRMLDAHGGYARAFLEAEGV